MRLPAAVTLSVTLAAGSLALSACGSQSASSALKGWTHSSDLSGALAQLTLDARHALTTLDNAHSTGPQLHTVCAVLDVEALQANSSLPTPDAQTTNLLSSAYIELGDAANECYGAGTSALKRARAASYLHRAGAALSEARARVASLVSN